MIGRILSLGIPSGVENSMFQLGKLSIQSSVSTLGTVAIAAQAMTNILENLNGIAAIGVGIGLMTVVGQCLGAGRKDEAIYYIKTKHPCGNHHHRKLPPGIRPDHPDNQTRRNGTPKRPDVLPHGNLDHHRQTNRMGNGLRPCLRPQSRRRRKILHAHLLHHHVGLPILPLRISHPLQRLRPNGRMDWNVHRLDCPRNRILLRFHSRKWLNHKVV